MEVLLTKHEQKRARRRAQRRLSSTSVSSDVLMELLAVGVATYQGLRRWPFTIVSRERDRAWRELYKEYMRQEERTIHRLKRQQLVKAERVQDGLRVILTEQGYREALRLLIVTTRTPLREGECCCVSFDIPELAREERNAFRRLLRQAGFEMVHQSLWRSPFDVVKPLSLLIEIDSLSKVISVFRGLDLVGSDIARPDYK